MLMRPAWYTPVEAIQPSHVSFWKSVVFLINQHPKHFISSKHVPFFPQLRQLPTVAPNDVAVDGLVKR